MAGKSMKRIIETAKNTGYVDDDENLADVKSISDQQSHQYF